MSIPPSPLLDTPTSSSPSVITLRLFPANGRTWTMPLPWTSQPLPPPALPAFVPTVSTATHSRHGMFPCTFVLTRLHGYSIVSSSSPYSCISPPEIVPPLIVPPHLHLCFPVDSPLLSHRSRASIVRLSRGRLSLASAVRKLTAPHVCPYSFSRSLFDLCSRYCPPDSSGVHTHARTVLF